MPLLTHILGDISGTSGDNYLNITEDNVIFKGH